MRSFFYALKHALNGVGNLLRFERNFQIHIVVLFVVLILGFILEITKMDWLFICIAAGGGLTAEALNSSVEKLSDFITQDKDERIKWIKDVAAAGVLIATITAIIIGLIVFYHPIIEFFND
jgi:diacylglycerol kinase